MIKRYICLLFVIIIGILGCGCNQNDPDILQPDDFITETAENITLSDEYYKISEKYRQLYLDLKFDICVPTDMKVYDSGESSGIVILSDSAGKNFITLETKPRSDYEIVYHEYLNTVTSGIGNRDNIQVYDDFTIKVFKDETPLELQAKRFDIKAVTLEKGDSEKLWYTIGKKCISYWFINFDAIEKDNKTLIPKTCFVIMTETFIPEGSSDFSNVDIMQKIVNTIDLGRYLKNVNLVQTSQK